MGEREDKMKKLLLLPVFLTVMIFYVGTAFATPVTVNGLTFSEQSGAFEITGGSGTGTLADPITITEMVTDFDVIMSIEGLSSSFGNPANTGHSSGFYLEKIITNNTGETWNFYDLELQ